MPTVAIKVGSVHAHPRTRLPILAVGHASRQPCLFKLSAALVDEEKVGHRIVSDEEVYQAIVVDIGRNRAERFSGRVRNPRFLAHVRECAVAAVMEEITLPRLEKARNTIVATAPRFVGAENLLRLVVIDEA